MYFAYVKFIVDDCRKVLQSTYVKDFHPVDVDDYDKDHVYSCFWEGDTKTRGGYYDAKILHMTESKEEMDEYLGARAPKVTKAAKQARQTKPKQKVPARKRREAAKRVAESELLNDMCSSEEETAGTSSYIEKELKAVKEENQLLRTLNYSLQEALCSKVLKRDADLLSKRNSVSCDTSAAAEEVRHPLLKSGNKSHQARRTSRNDSTSPSSVSGETYMVMEGTLIANVDGTAAGTLSDLVLCTEETKQDTMADQVSEDLHCGTLSAPLSGECSMDDSGPNDQGSDIGSPPSSDHTAVPVGQQVNGKFHAGSGVWLNKTAWERLMSSDKDSLFVKNAAVAIWSTEVLAQRSVTGKISNRHAREDKTAQAPLTPHKLQAVYSLFRHYAQGNGADEEEIKRRSKFVRKYLSEKMSQLRR